MYTIQHADVNASVRDYNHLSIGELLVSKTFLTIQGEGPFAGMRAFFVRLAGCNRGDKKTGCGFCDTEFRLSKGTIRPMSSVIEEAEGYGARLVVITGGEPMLQSNLSEFTHRLSRSNIIKQVQIETNGDMLSLGMDKWSNFVHIVVSPKIVESRATYRRLSPDVVQRMDSLKLLADARKESPYNCLPTWLPWLTNERSNLDVFISPIAVYRRAVRPNEVANAWDHTLIDAELTKANYNYAAELCMTFGYRLSIQQHIFCQLQ